MTESAEHQFLSECVTRVLSQLSHTNLYAYVEAERRKFDFACELVRDWSRPLVGQTLWNHTAGIDKDLRTMMLDSDAEICAYVARDTVKARRLLSEVMKDFHTSGISVAPHRLRVFWVPQDFDADDEAQRDLVAELLRDSVSRDILMNVVFGNIAPEDVRFFVRASGLAGLHLALLHAISTAREPYSQVKDLAVQFGVSVGAIRERLLRLFGCGFLTQFGGGATLAKATLKGRVFLDLCGELQRQAAAGHLTAEMLQILRLLEMRYAPSAVQMATDSLHLAGPLLAEVPEMVTGRLIATITVAAQRWGIGFETIDHMLWEDEEPLESRGSGTRAIIDRLRRESDLYSL
ncbi:hypothetical protein [Nonomuraea angiospora]|uniref:hypothetical protein n=1 Tax=Nonomuraea angiospora TaxID=46172 RepID=UPI0029BED6B3|nr:hypothetical protein [Nonomuraea angiospora]MDX3101629.1 hypothetical protein [Nonomuraea angiospora]